MYFFLFFFLTKLFFLEDLRKQRRKIEVNKEKDKNENFNIFTGLFE